MNDNQRVQFYFVRCWNPTALALDWSMVDGRLVANLADQLTLSRRWPDHGAALYQEIYSSALKLADDQHRAVTPVDLRHACNLIASNQRTDSSKLLKQREVNHFDRLCTVLRDPWDLNARLAWLNPIQDDCKRLVAYIRTTSWEAAVIAIAGNKYRGRHWTDLQYDELNNVVREVRDRPHYQRPVQRKQFARV